MLKKVKQLLNEMGGGSGIKVSCKVSDIEFPENLSIAFQKGKTILTGINSNGDIILPLKVSKFSAEGYYDGMDEVRGDILVLDASFGKDFLPHIKQLVQKEISRTEPIHEDIFPAATQKQLIKRRKDMPITLTFDLSSMYTSDPSDVVFGGYMRAGGWKGFQFDWNVDVAVQMDSAERETELDYMPLSISGSLNEEGQWWYKDVFEAGPTEEDLQDPDDPEHKYSEESWWDMHWEDVRINWGAK